LEFLFPHVGADGLSTSLRAGPARTRANRIKRSFFLNPAPFGEHPAEERAEIRFWQRVGFAIIKYVKEIRMATTSTPEVKPAESTPKPTPITFTPNAVAKVKEIMAQQSPVPAGLRVGVVGGGCSGFSYSMAFENGAGMMDKVFNIDGLKVFVDATSAMYLNGCTVDYIETLEGAGFKFDNPNVKSTCGCGSSFSV
jgi:iron-sulfur cluster assembly accessory protein